MLQTLRPQLVDLDEPVAVNPELTGAKAAALAVAAAAGLPTLGGVVLTTSFADELGGGVTVAEADATLKAFDRAGGDAHLLVVRSSSVAEDGTDSSMAGQFASVIGVRGFDEFQAAVQTVLDSRRQHSDADGPMAVLVQPLVDPVLGGVVFGVDPVTGRSDRRVITAVAGSPVPLVGGLVEGAHYVIDATGAIIESAPAPDADIPRRELRRLVSLAERAAGIFGGPQDIEWAIDAGGRLWLLQSRPVTTMVRGVPSGPVYGPGPVAETFPEALSRLEADLWVPPLRDGVRSALRLARITGTAQLDQSRIVVCTGGRVAIDLALVGDDGEADSRWQRLDPRRSVRRLWAAWRVGRLRAALGALAEDLLVRADADLVAVPGFDQLSNRQLLALVHRGRDVLCSLQAHEILMGLLMEPARNPLTGASVALRVLAEARRDGLSDDEIIAANPVVLALTGPRVAPRPALPREVDDFAVADATTERGPEEGLLREALRLRIRWVHELTGRAAWTLGERLVATGDLDEPASIRHFSLDDLDGVVTGRSCTRPGLVANRGHRDTEPLPARFQLSDRGWPIAIRHGEAQSQGRGAGGGIGEGPVTFDTTDPAVGTVLVVRYLTPGLGSVLPRLAGIVSETGSVLSHLAILAREAQVPTVVGYPEATTRLTEGARVEVDGDRGDVRVLSPGEVPA